MNDIKQLTNFSTAASIEQGVEPDKHGNYIDYKIFNFINPIIKLGYCCEPCGIGIPIYITFEEEVNGVPTEIPKPFEIGKTGMFEFQNQDLILDEGEVKTDEKLEKITSVKLPYQMTSPVAQDILFKFDYVEEEG